VRQAWKDRGHVLLPLAPREPMALLIDPPSWPAHGRLWSHLASDVSVEELHAFARALGVPERGFEGDHYDLPEDRYAAALDAGALPVPTRELLRRVRAAGLRRPKRRGEIVILSRPLASGGRVDTLVSTRPPRRPVSGLVLLAARAETGQVLGLPGGLAPRLAVTGDRAGASAVDLTVDLAVELAVELAADLTVDLAVELAAAVLLAPGAGRNARQIGYLRLLEADPADVRIDLVVAVNAAAHEPRSPAGWMDADVLAATAPELAPLIMLALRPAPSR
jgi:hypothetical protein